MKWDDKSWDEVRWDEMRWSVERGVWSVSAKCEVWTPQFEVWSFKCDLWSSASVSHRARTHGPGWLTAHASSIGEKKIMYIPKATSAPPRAGTTGTFVCYLFILVTLRSSRYAQLITNPSWPKATPAFRMLCWETIPFLERHIHGRLQSDKKHLISCKLMQKTLLWPSSSIPK